MASSQFYHDLSKVEKKLMKFTWRQVKAMLLLTGTLVVVVIEMFILPDIAFYFVAIPTIFLLATYPTLLLINRWRQVKRLVELNLLHEESYYFTGQIRRYEAHEFIQKKGINEADKIETINETATKSNR